MCAISAVRTESKALEVRADMLSLVKSRIIRPSNLMQVLEATTLKRLLPYSVVRRSLDCQAVERRVGIIFYRASSYASAVLGVVILSICSSVCPSVRLPHACFLTKSNNALPIFSYHTKGQSL